MLQRCNNLVQMGSMISDTRFNIIIMSSPPESYRPTLQMITAAKHTSHLASRKMSVMKHNNLIAFILEEAQHRVINDKHTKTAETALATYTKKGKQNKAGKQKKSKRNSTTNTEECDNCSRPSHTTIDSFSKGGGKCYDSFPFYKHMLNMLCSFPSYYLHALFHGHVFYLDYSFLLQHADNMLYLLHAFTLPFTWGFTVYKLGVVW